MLARRICNSSFMAVKAARIQSQVRLLNVSAIALREEKPVMDQGAKQFNNDLKKDKPQSNMTMYYVGGAVVAVGAAYLIMKNTGMIGKKVEDTKDTVAGAYLTHKANQEFEKYKDIIVKVAKEIGGKDLADKVSKVIDEAKDTVTKMAGDMNVSQTAGKAYRQGKDAIQTISEGGISKYIGEFDNVKDMVVKEAKKLGGDDLAKKAGKIFDEAKDKMSKLKDVKDLEGVKDYILKETKKVGGDDLVKQATKYLDEAKNTVQNVAGAIGQHGFGDAEYEKVKDFVVKEAKQIGGDELAKKAAKLMDEAKETIQKIAKEFSQHGDLSDKAGKAYQHVKDQVKKA